MLITDKLLVYLRVYHESNINMRDITIAYSDTILIYQSNTYEHAKTNGRKLYKFYPFTNDDRCRILQGLEGKPHINPGVFMHSQCINGIDYQKVFGRAKSARQGNT